MSTQIAQADSALILPNFKTTSLIIAEKFGKQHKDVLRKIEALEIPVDFNERNFAPVEYIDAKGEARPDYELTRDGFALLVMGFTGKRAMAWKIKFLEAFNAMEVELHKPIPDYPFDPRELMRQTRDQADRFREILDLMNTLHRDAVSTFSKAHHNVAFAPRPEPGKTIVRTHQRKLPGTAFETIQPKGKCQ